MATMTFKKVVSPKTTNLLLRCTRGEKEAVRTQAQVANLSMSEFMLRAALKHPISVKTDLHMVHELRFFIQGLRDIYHTEQPLNDERLRPVLAAAVEALNRVVGRSHQIK
jgi:hypothetical protein